MRICPCPKHRIAMKASWFATRAASKDPRVMTLACFSCMWGTCPPLMDGNRTQLPIAILLCVAFALPAGVVRADENHKPVRTWKVKESQDVPANERRSLSLTPNTLDEETTDGVVVSIPFVDIIGLAHSVRDRRPVREAMRKMHKDNYDPENIKEAMAEDPRVIIAVPLIPVMDAAEQLVLTPFQGIKSRWHFVYIHWERDGEEHFETFRLSRKSAFSLLAELQKATGKDVETLDFSEKVDLRHTNRILLNFNESAWVGNTLLSPGRKKRSEEHTSELQSPDHLVCRLLLEKKKTHNKTLVSGDADIKSSIQLSNDTTPVHSSPS